MGGINIISPNNHNQLAFLETQGSAINNATSSSYC